MGAGLVRMIIIQLKDDVDTGSSNLEWSEMAVAA